MVFYVYNNMKTILTILLLIGQLTYAQDYNIRYSSDSTLRAISYNDRTHNRGIKHEGTVLEIYKDGDIYVKYNLVELHNTGIVDTSYVNSVDMFSPDSKKLYFSCTKNSYEYDIKTRQFIQLFTDSKIPVTFLRCEKDYMVLMGIRQRKNKIEYDKLSDRYIYKNGEYTKIVN